MKFNRVILATRIITCQTLCSLSINRDWLMKHLTVRLTCCLIKSYINTRVFPLPTRSIPSGNSLLTIIIIIIIIIIFLPTRARIRGIFSFLIFQRKMTERIIGLPPGVIISGTGVYKKYVKNVNAYM